MIDTDKYEGHTPAPWDSLVCATTGKKWIIDGPEENWSKAIALVEGIGENDVGWINMWLMADAPLLLAEVKRLYEMMEVLASFHIVKNVEQGFTQREWVELVELVKRGEEE